MNKQIFFYIILIFLINNHCFCQDINEAFKFSNLSPLGTARSIGFGNALGSIGGDISVLSVNPAGLGVYRTSEILITPSINENYINANYLNNKTNENNSNININQFGLVITNAAKGKKYDRRNWKTISFAFGMNKMADFNQTYNYQGKNYTSSSSQVFESDANINKNSANDPSTLGYLGINSNLLTLDTNGYKTKVPFNNGVTQFKYSETTGGINEFVLSLGGNYKEKILLGVTLGIPIINYENTNTFSEVLNNPTINNPNQFNSFSYNNDLRIYGSGMNLKLGAILKLTNFFRIGAAFHTPTYYNITETLNTTISSNFNGNITTLSSPIDIPTNNFNYTLSTPWKGVLSASFLIRNFIFITADYEYVDYSTMKYHYSSDFIDDQNTINQTIRNTYKSASNIRIGSELKLGKSFYIRAGIGYYGNPYKSADSSTEKINLSNGLGFHFKHFYTDLGYLRSIYKEKQQAYTINYSGILSSNVTTIPQAKIDFNLASIAWTIGYKF